MLLIITSIIVSYLLGSIPTAYLFVRAIKGLDIRKSGSGNVGATNASRILGKKLGILILFLDILKGFLAVIFIGNFLCSRISCSIEQEALLRIIIGLSCISGHNWTIFLGFKGGKGVATTLGVLIGIGIAVAGLKLILLLVVLTWAVVFIFTRIVSLSSLSAAITFPLYMTVFKQSPILIISSIALSAFIIIRHKSNIQRLIKHQEPRI